MPNQGVDGQDAATGGGFFVWDLPDRWEVIMPAENAVNFSTYPVELRYVLALQPSRIKQVEGLLERGYGIGVRNRYMAGHEAAPAVRRLTVLQDNALVPWIQGLFANGRAPTIDERMHETAAERGWDPERDLRFLGEALERQRHFSLIQTPGTKPADADTALLADLNRDLRQISVGHFIGSVAHAAGPRPEPTLWTLAAAVFVLGPLLHVLAWVAPWAAIVLGAVGLSAGWEIWRVRETHRSGAAAWQIRRKVVKGLPGVMLALGFGVLSAALLPTMPVLGAWCFGLAITSPHWARLARAIDVQRELYDRLASSGRMDAGQRKHWLKHAVISSFGVWTVASLASLVACGLILGFWPGAATNGWVLAGLSALPWAVYDAGSLVRIYGSDWLFRRRLEGLLKRTVLLVT